MLAVGFRRGLGGTLASCGDLQWLNGSTPLQTLTQPGLLPETLQDQQPTAGKEGITKREALKQFGTFLLGFGVILFVVGLGYWIYLVTYCDGPARFSSVNAYYFCRGYFSSEQLDLPGLANSMPVLIASLMYPGLVLAVAGDAILVYSKFQRRKLNISRSHLESPTDRDG